MKTFVSGVILAVGLWNVACTSSSDTAITVKDNEEAYTFSAHYDKSRTAALQEYLTDALGPEAWTSQVDINQTTTLPDQTTFHVETSAGQLAIEMDKSSNKPAAYQRLKKVCEGMRNVILDK